MVSRLIRDRTDEKGREVGYVELFFDLIFVFAITRLSHLLLENLQPSGVLEAGILLAAVWWVWIDTSWITNWLNPERSAVRILVFALMGAGLVMSTSIPEAFANKGLVFACAFALIQVGRSLFALVVIHDDHQQRANFRRISVWAVCVAALWIAGGLVEGEARIACWVAGLALQFLGPIAGYVVPGLGRSTTEDWQIEGEHLSERVGLFIIICLGESILITGETFAGLEWAVPVVLAFAASFVMTVSMWWLFFSQAHDAASEELAQADDAAELARRAFTYFPILVVAGIVVTAVGDELVLDHPLGQTDAAEALVLAGGPLLFLLGTVLATLAIWKRVAWARAAAMLVLAVLGLASPGMDPLTLTLLATAVLTVTAIWEHFAGHWRRL